MNTPIRNNDFYRYVGYDPSSNKCIVDLFSEANLNVMSNKITELTYGLDMHNRPIIVPHDTIANVLSAIYANYRPQTGDIYGRYNVPSGRSDNMVQDIISRTIELIVSQLRTEYATLEANSKLTVWTTVYGDFNEHFLRAHPIIKVREKRPNPMEFNMNY